MSKSLKIDPAVHAIAKVRADSCGMKLHAFVERAIKAFHPRTVLDVAKDRSAPAETNRRLN